MGEKVFASLAVIFSMLAWMNERRPERTLDALEEWDARLRQLTAHVPGIVYRCRLDSDWTMVFISDGVEELTGYAAPAFTSNAELAFAELIHPADAARVEREVRAAAETMSTWALRYRLRHRDGTERWVFERGRAVANEHGIVSHLDGAIVDVTAQVEVEQALEATRRELEARNAELEAASEALEGAKASEDALFDAMSELLPGSVLAGRYRMEELLGAGGMGVVYRATQLGLERPVAIKVLRPLGRRGARADRLRKRFEREARSACAVKHPNAVVIHDAGSTPAGLVFLVMELLVGHPVSAELEEVGRLPFARAIEVAATVADVLGAAHEAGIVHRDVKPDNVFIAQVGDGETVKVLDFGLAKLVDVDGRDAGQSQLTEHGQLIGTPDYMSPERLSLEGELSGAADVYSLGMMLFEMLTGRLPYDIKGDSPAHLVAAHLFQAPRRASEIVPSLPTEVDALLLAALAKDPSARPSARELEASLRALL